jgi:hypothetical protein
LFHIQKKRESEKLRNLISHSLFINTKFEL